MPAEGGVTGEIDGVGTRWPVVARGTLAAGVDELGAATTGAVRGYGGTTGADGDTVRCELECLGVVGRVQVDDGPHAVALQLVEDGPGVVGRIEYGPVDGGPGVTDAEVGVREQPGDRIVKAPESDVTDRAPPRPLVGLRDGAMAAAGSKELTGGKSKGPPSP